VSAGSILDWRSHRRPTGCRDEFVIAVSLCGGNRGAGLLSMLGPEGEGVADELGSGITRGLNPTHSFRVRVGVKSRRIRRFRITVPVDKNNVSPWLRRLILWHSRGNHARQQYHRRSQFHGAIPARPSRVSSIRLRPSSRPLQSNHSCKVWAPPPVPPPPMAMASRPSDSGILASVEAR
jgi:hypothetical protein